MSDIAAQIIEETVRRRQELPEYDGRPACAEAYMHWARKMMEEVEGKSE